MYCRKCGAKLPEGVKICTQCKTALLGGKQPKKKKKSAAVLILLLVLCLAAGGFAGFLFYKTSAFRREMESFADRKQEYPSLGKYGDDYEDIQTAAKRAAGSFRFWEYEPLSAQMDRVTEEVTELCEAIAGYQEEYDRIVNDVDQGQYDTEGFAEEYESAKNAAKEALEAFDKKLCKEKIDAFGEVYEKIVQNAGQNAGKNETDPVPAKDETVSAKTEPAEVVSAVEQGQFTDEMKRLYAERIAELLEKNGNYVDYLTSEFGILYIDEDEIPEIIMTAGNPMDDYIFYLLWLKDGEVCSLSFDGYSYVSYIPHSGLIEITHGMGMVVPERIIKIPEAVLVGNGEGSLREYQGLTEAYPDTVWVWSDGQIPLGGKSSYDGSYDFWGIDGVKTLAEAALDELIGTEQYEEERNKVFNAALAVDARAGEHVRMSFEGMISYLGDGFGQENMGTRSNEAFGIRQDTSEEVGNALDTAGYRYYDSGVENFHFWYPAEIYNQVYVDESDRIRGGEGIGKNIRTVSFLGSGGSSLVFSLIQKEDYFSIDGVIDSVLFQENSTLYDVEEIVHSNDGEKGKLIVTGWDSAARDLVYYELTWVEGDYIMQMRIVFPKYLDDEDKYRKSYITECLYRMCGFSGSTAEVRSYAEFVESQKSGS